MRRDELDILIRVIRGETRFLRSYDGRVLDDADPLTRGRVRVEIPGLNWLGQAAVWCWPRDIDAMIPAQVGDIVEVRFVNAQANRPVYGGLAHEATAAKPDAYDGPDTAVVYQSREGVKIVHDRAADVLTIDDSHGNIIVMDSMSIRINEHLEVLR